MKLFSPQILQIHTHTFGLSCVFLKENCMPPPAMSALVGARPGWSHTCMQPCPGIKTQESGPQINHGSLPCAQLPTLIACWSWSQLLGNAWIMFLMLYQEHAGRKISLFVLKNIPWVSHLLHGSRSEGLKKHRKTTVIAKLGTPPLLGESFSAYLWRNPRSDALWLSLLSASGAGLKMCRSKKLRHHRLSCGITFT